MQKIIIALALTVFTAGSLVASENTRVMATVQQLVDACNKGDTRSLVPGCPDQMCIIDEFPPHEWHGAGTCSKWLEDYNADAKKNGITDGNVTIGNPRHVDVTGNRAYVVVPANYAYKQMGKPVKETGSTWTFTPRKARLVGGLLDGPGQSIKCRRESNSLSLSWDSASSCASGGAPACFPGSSRDTLAI